jgi:hypothetical protein
MVICPRQWSAWQSLALTCGSRVEYTHAGRPHFIVDYIATCLHQPGQRNSLERHQLARRSVSTVFLYRHHRRSCPQASFRASLATTSLELGQVWAADQHCRALRYGSSLVLLALAARAACDTGQHELGEYHVRRCHDLRYCLLRDMGSPCL